VLIVDANLIKTDILGELDHAYGVFESMKSGNQQHGSHAVGESGEEHGDSFHRLPINFLIAAFRLFSISCQNSSSERFCEK
jgi:hypothetical protein